MHRIVNHDQRRDEIVRATWRIIAKHGMAKATMRQIAAEAGFANGALKPYFPTKGDLLMATYQHVFARTNERASERTASLRGLEALTASCIEIVPLDADRLDEARVVIEFWAEATTDPAALSLFERTMREWKLQMLTWCAEIDPDRDWGTKVDALLAFVLGTQISGVMMPGVSGSSEQLKAQLDEQLRQLVRE